MKNNRRSNDGTDIIPSFNNAQKEVSIIVISLMLACMGYVQTQAQSYICLKKAFDNVELFEKRTVPSYSTPYYMSIEETGKLSKNKDGSYTFFSWGAGLDAPYHDGDYSSPFAVEGIRNRPTHNISLTISKQGIKLKTYNDVQVATDFYENTGDIMKDGSAKKPADPFSETYGCKTGSRQTNVSFQLGKKTYQCKANFTCQHDCKRLIIVQANKRYNVLTHKYDVVAVEPGGSSDFLSPWKFMHTVNCFISFDEMAKSVGISREELIKRIMSDGLPNLFSGDFVFWSDQFYISPLERIEKDPFFSDVIVYALAKLNGYNKETLQKLQNEEREAASKLFQNSMVYYNDARSTRKIDDTSSLKSAEQAITGFYTLLSNNTIADSIKAASYQYYVTSLIIHLFAAYELSIDNEQYIPTYQQDLKRINGIDFPSSMKGQMYRGLGIISNRHKLYLEADEQYNIAMQHFKDSNDEDMVKDCLVKTIENIIEKGGYDEAYQLSSRANQSFPQEIVFLDLKGRSLILNGNNKEALKVWKKEILALDPTYANQNSSFYKLLIERKIIK